MPPCIRYVPLEELFLIKLFTTFLTFENFYQVSSPSPVFEWSLTHNTKYFVIRFPFTLLYHLCCSPLHLFQQHYIFYQVIPPTLWAIFQVWFNQRFVKSCNNFFFLHVIVVYISPSTWFPSLAASIHCLLNVSWILTNIVLWRQRNSLYTIILTSPEY